MHDAVPAVPHASRSPPGLAHRRSPCGSCECRDTGGVRGCSTSPYRHVEWRGVKLRAPHAASPQRPCVAAVRITTARAHTCWRHDVGQRGWAAAGVPAAGAVVGVGVGHSVGCGSQQHQRGRHPRLPVGARCRRTKGGVQTACSVPSLAVPVTPHGGNVHSGCAGLAVYGRHVCWAGCQRGVGGLADGPGRSDQ